jgi:hypothetical protein
VVPHLVVSDLADDDVSEYFPCLAVELHQLHSVRSGKSRLPQSILMPDSSKIGNIMRFNACKYVLIPYHETALLPGANCG